MSLPEDDKKMGALKREWAAARVVIIGGFIVAIAVAGYFYYRARQEQLAQQPIVHTTVVRPKVDAKTLARAELAVCTAELMRAKDVGAIPTYGQLATGQLVRAPDAPQRFICEARTHLTSYYISADVMCDKLADPRCVSVYRVATKERQLIYDRPQ
jgi:predicted negative regulator of RcsB-dependent stress response